MGLERLKKTEAYHRARKPQQGEVRVVRHQRFLTVTCVARSPGVELAAA
jgi:hypothetical protein